ncbi:MAG: HypC/HybG/HupF family hydrogenase formation chaperone [Patescibacteria group bacterium]|nr:HypC/HybG/HupF family hydrogenase formation chaperone [Patescibacteria group bacterium]MBU1160399.1 HypC/HybG/HupF family hydrogenase formation chaperone [Patescibacteria group bacterium]MBU1349719.1 HypC/HybG/HupF family hydrogenase formation chaperone [Patescibacteria group bacterium]MBU1420869.1 HypC/HybG/HupF family hydrogenase formation chaperone [Patescibacteria group bacterium]MBU1684491.1 HypC/HybG/HupF family hydrogenase formation chaperone [Patescibacteria group bacterium]
MCLAIPAKIKKIKDKHAIVDFEGLKKDIIIILTPEVRVGDYVLVHAGFSIQKINKKEANEALKIWSKI